MPHGDHKTQLFRAAHVYSSTIFSQTFGTGFAMCTSLTMSGAGCFRSIRSLIFLLAACDWLMHAGVKALESQQIAPRAWSIVEALGMDQDRRRRARRRAHMRHV